MGTVERVGYSRRIISFRCSAVLISAMICLVLFPGVYLPLKSCFQICSLLVKTEVGGASAFKLTTTLGWDDNFKGATFLLATCLSFA